MSKLSVTQLVILSNACQRDNRLVLPLPDRIKGGAARKVVASLVTMRLVEEVYFVGVSWPVQQVGIETKREDRCRLRLPGKLCIHMGQRNLSPLPGQFPGHPAKRHPNRARRWSRPGTVRAAGSGHARSHSFRTGPAQAHRDGEPASDRGGGRGAAA